MPLEKLMIKCQKHGNVFPVGASCAACDREARMIDLLKWLRDFVVGHVLIDFDVDCARQAANEIERLRERIKELEKIQRHSYMGACVCPAHHTTDEQIAAAVEMARKLEHDPQWKRMADAIWDTLELFNIFRCGSCEGIGAGVSEICTDCNGDGYEVRK